MPKSLGFSMIDLYQFPPLFNVPNLSPFCMKVEGFLRIADIPFEIIATKDSQQAPKGKLPYIRDNGIAIADSELIMDYLESKLEFRVDGHLSSMQRASHHAFIRMLDEHVYWALQYSRYEEESNWQILKQHLYGHIAPPASTLMAAKARYKVRQQLHAHGLGRHNREEVYAKACKDIAELALLLGDKKWFGGNYVSKLDLTALAYLSNILIPELPSQLSDCVKKHGNLETFCVRAERIIFPKSTQASAAKLIDEGEQADVSS